MFLVIADDRWIVGIYPTAADADAAIDAGTLTLRQRFGKSIQTRQVNGLKARSQYIELEKFIVE